MSNSFQSSSSSCNYNITGGGSIQKQLDSLFSSSKKTLSSLTKSLVGTKKPLKRKSTTKKPVKRKSTTKKPVKRKSTTKKGGTTSNPQRYYENNEPNNLVNSLNSKMKLMGGNGSDFIGTVSSRGPINYPNSEGTGMTGEDLFRTFNKTGTYIPHHKANVAGALTDGILNRKLI